MKKLITYGKKLIFSSFLLYGYNFLVQPLNLMIPINIITVLLVTFLGVPALISLIVILIYVY